MNCIVIGPDEVQPGGEPLRDHGLSEAGPPIDDLL